MVENTKRTTVYFNKIMYIYNEDQHCIFITKINIFRARKHENMNCIYYFYTTKESKRLADVSSTLNYSYNEDTTDFYNIQEKLHCQTNQEMKQATRHFSRKSERHI